MTKCAPYGVTMKIKLLLSALAALSLLTGVPRALAQQSSPVAGPALSTLPPPQAPPRRYSGRRIEIYPGRLLYRRCVDWYELQHRPSGTVLYPQMHCWWVRG
jgi:hypothetical protein